MELIFQGQYQSIFYFLIKGNKSLDLRQSTDFFGWIETEKLYQNLFQKPKKEEMEIKKKLKCSDF